MRRGKEGESERVIPFLKIQHLLCENVAHYTSLAFYVPPAGHRELAREKA